MTFSLLEICPGGGGTLLQTRAPIGRVTCWKPTSFPTLSLTPISEILKKCKSHCCRVSAKEYFPLLHLFLVPNIVKILATTTCQLPTMHNILSNVYQFSSFIISESEILNCTFLLILQFLNTNICKSMILRFTFWPLQPYIYIMLNLKL